MSHEGLHAVDSLDLLEPCLECHRASVALDGLEALQLDSLEGVRIHQLGHGSVLSHIFDSPFHVDGRKLELSAGPHSEGDQCHGEHSRSIVPYSAPSVPAYSDPQGVCRACCHALAAEGAVH